LLPGLIEGHSHVFLEGAELDFEKRKAYQAQSPDDLLTHARIRLQKIVQMGVVAMRDGGDKDRVGLTLRAEVNGVPPCIISPGAAIHHKGRYGSFIGGPVEDYATPAACVAGRVAEGADHIKILPTGIINFQKGQVTQPPQMTAEEVTAFVAAARQHDKHVMAHASGTPGIENAILGGVDTIEHGFFVTRDQLGRMRDQNVAWVPTFMPVQVQVDEAEKMGWDAKVVGNLQKILDDHATRLREADGMGVTIVAGSDAGSYGVAHGLGLLYELELMEKAGLAPIKVLRSATGASVSRLPFGQKVGWLKPGYVPHMILTQLDPLQTVAHLKKERWVSNGWQWRHSVSDQNTDGL
jgi:imidazolonepropionase-like amidohydrolase